MAQYFIPKEKVPTILKLGIERDPYEWNVVFATYIKFLLPEEKQDFILQELLDKGNETNQDEIKMMASLATIEMVLKKYPILVLEPALEPLIEDTTPDLKHLKIPFPAYFINKKFKFKNGHIMGIFVIDMCEFFKINLTNVGMNKDEVEKLTEYMLIDGAGSNVSNMFFVCVYITEEFDITVLLSDIREVEQSINKMPRQVASIAKRAMFYAGNVSNLLVTHANLENLQDSKKDVRVISDNHKGESKTMKKIKPPYSVIRVFGNLKDYTKSYNKDKRKYATNNVSMIVRGHWRHLNSPVFKNKQGEAIWIPPYIKGVDKSLHQRLIKVKK